LIRFKLFLMQNLYL